MLPDNFKQQVEAHLATMPTQREMQELATLRRAVVHAAVEMQMVVDAVKGRPLQTHHSVAFTQGAAAAIDTMDICFKRHLSNVNPSTYAHALEKSFEDSHKRFLEARAMLVRLGNMECISSHEIHTWLENNLP